MIIWRWLMYLYGERGIMAAERGRDECHRHVMVLVLSDSYGWPGHAPEGIDDHHQIYR